MTSRLLSEPLIIVNALILSKLISTLISKMLFTVTKVFRDRVIMSDDDIDYVARHKVVHFGAIDGAGIPEAADSDNIQVSTQYIAMDKDAHNQEKIAMLEEFERKRKVKAINVSTSDTEVKEDLRKLGEPICLFGEGPADRRNRLRELLGRLGEDVIKRRRIMDDMTKEEDEDKSDKTEQTWYPSKY